MAKQSRGYDVWLTSANRVYRAVPFDVLTDWLQQGRVVADDRLRPSGAGEWQRMADVSAFAAFLPRADSQQPNDMAEAFEPIALAVPIRRRPADDDDDVDMIPLIDISLVLLIFFMMTATVAVAGAGIDTPAVYNGNQISTDPLMIWIGVDRAENGTPVYSIGQGDKPAAEGDERLPLPQVLDRLDARLKAASVGCPVRVAGNKRLPFGTVRQLTAELEKRRGPNRITDIKAEVNEKSS
ncbi:MAG TPA: biopolymer transporter ExbD [Gemmataceae bacterium]|jgi:biopolymer transport protein ExbD|nr:biopolymer transporter ExbD [Gemmataceae bacterium]